jgi:hypothetical protein
MCQPLCDCNCYAQAYLLSCNGYNNILFLILYNMYKVYLWSIINDLSWASLFLYYAGLWTSQHNILTWGFACLMYRKRAFHNAWYRGWMALVDCTYVNILLFLQSHLFCHPQVNLGWSCDLLGICPFIILFVHIYIPVFVRFDLRQSHLILCVFNLIQYLK